MLATIKKMSAKSEDKMIMKLLEKGEREYDIIDYLKKQGMVDEVSIYRVQRKIREFNAAKAFTADSRRSYTGKRVYGAFLILASVVLFFFVWSIWLVFLFVAGIVLLFFPDEA